MNFAPLEILQDFISLFYPRYCLACECALVKGEEIICTRCLLEMPKTDYHLDSNNPFQKKLQGRVDIKHVMALYKFVKESRVQHLLHALKYKNHPEVGVSLGRVYGNDLLNAGFKNQFDLIVPVPLHTSRKAMRGYNQSYEFAKGLSEALEVPIGNCIVRVAKTQTQTNKTRLNRWENVNEVFRVEDPAAIINQKILLVDDVITTGATLEACANILKGCNYKELSIACIAAAQ
jgi:ComF family protein